VDIGAAAVLPPPIKEMDLELMKSIPIRPEFPVLFPQIRAGDPFYLRCSDQPGEKTHHIIVFVAERFDILWERQPEIKVVQPFGIQRFDYFTLPDVFVDGLIAYVQLPGKRRPVKSRVLDVGLPDHVECRLIELRSHRFLFTW